MKKEKRKEAKEKRKQVRAARKRILKIYPVSLGRFVAVIWAFFGLLLSIVINIFFPQFLPNIGGRGSIVLLPIIYGIYGFIIGIVCAFIFNVIAKRRKGLIQVEVIQKVPRAKKEK